MVGMRETIRGPDAGDWKYETDRGMEGDGSENRQRGIDWRTSSGKVG
jgi:hypothetical protein